MGKVLSLYFARQFARTLLAMLVFGSFVIFLADYVNVLSRYSDDEGFTGMLGVKLAAMRVPILLDGALPFAFLFTALISLLELSRKLELVVARASGISAWGFLRAPFAVAILFGIATTAVLNPIAVELREQATSIEAELSGRAVWGSGRWFRQDGSNGPSIMHVTSAEEDGRTIRGVTAFVYDQNGKFREKVESSHGEHAPNRWILTDAMIVSAKSPPHRVPRYELPTTLTMSEVRRGLVEPDTISVWALPKFIETARRAGLNPDPFRVAFQTLIGRPIFFIAMVLVAATVSLRLTRYGGTWRLLLTGATIGFLLYAFSEIVGDLGGTGIINPMLAAWLPPIVALIFGATALLIQEDG